ncbi:hypothetical protein E5K00_04940 [Hymenobacter aquaticus]|uniref:Uncharacterized protein n=1 Tax=Hymenobacter aquaticus TaxID=1867101 RepID=A0A4Z0Q775_9BACT|nr:hypothetical protein [Hymenobacter aquaticus]TGE24562.1 hypothetical protein E5K00_04940 [Hymenobacter aquaticus]
MVDLKLFPSTQPGVKDMNDTSLAEALESCFPQMNDGAVLLWNGVSVPLSYKFDLGIIIHDIIFLVQQLRTCSMGSFTICWPSNSFRVDWQVAVAAGRVQVTALWESVYAPVDALNASPVVEADQVGFMAQWLALLRFANQALLDTGYTAGELDDYVLLVEELAHHRQ